MKHLLKKSEMARLLAVAITAFACVCMWGCSDDVSFDWSNSRSDRMIAAFVDDSFVVVTDTRRWIESTEGWNGSYYEKEGCGNDRMCIYNYRVQEDGPRWCDSVSTESGSYRWFQLTDSVIWAGSPWDGAGSFIKLWKIGEKPVRRSLKTKKEDCQKTFMPNSYRPWLDGTFIGLNGESLNVGDDSCQYVVLDTAANTITYKRLGEALAWIKECDDVRAWSDEVYCLLRKKENLSVLLSVNNVIVDSLETDEKDKYAVYPALFAGHMLHLGDNICSLMNDRMKKYPNVQTTSKEIKFINAEYTVSY